MRATLHVVRGPDEGRLFCLGDAAVTIGRNADNTLVLNDVAVSGTHSKIVRNARGGYTILDSASTNGTFVNGAEQRAVDLKDGDEIRIGGTTFVFEMQRRSQLRLGATTGEGMVDVQAGSGDFSRLAPLPAQGELEASLRRYQILELLDRVLAAADGSGEVVSAALDAALAATRARRGVVLVTDEKTGEILPAQAREASGREVTVSFSTALALEALAGGVAFVRDSGEGLAGPVLVAPLGAGGRTAGVIYLDQPEQGTFSPAEMEAVASVGRKAGICLSAVKSRVDFDLLFSSMIDAIMKSIQAKDVYTRGHSERVRHYAKLLAKELGLSQDELARVSLGAGLHDIGKIGMPDSVLKFNQTPTLTAEQLDEVKKHPLRGGQILGDIPFLKDIVPAAELHHEDWNGGGYPHGLAGEEIPLIARIVAVADTYDAITTDRPYQKGKSFEEGHQILRKIAGKRLQPELVEAFISAFKKYRRAPSAETRKIKKTDKIMEDAERLRRGEPLDGVAEGPDLDEGLRNVILVG